MNFLSWFTLFIITVGAVSYFRLKLLNATIAIGIALIIGDLTGNVNLLGWILFLIPAVVLNNPNIRQKFISQKLLVLFRKVMPEMSSTEKAAIDAGTVWWDGQIFSGKPDWDKLHRIPQAQLTPEEQAFLDGPVEEVCKMVDDWQINHELADLPPEIWQYLKDNKFFAMIIKKEYGGLEFSAFAQSRVLQKLSGVNIVLTTSVGVPNSLGPGELLQHYGTQAQKDQYLPGLANGTEIPCFALTSPEAGSDAGAIPDTGVVCKGEWEGKETLGIMLNFDKRYITLAPISTVVGLAFKMYDPDGLLGDKKDIGITCALIPSNTPGLDIGRRHFPINIPFQNGPVRAKDLFVPLDFIIGGPQMAGEGWRMLVECLSVGRVITLPSNSAGGAKSVALATGAYARIRRQFKLPIGKMEGIEEMLGRIGGLAYMMDGVTRLSTKAVDMGEKPSVISAVCKYHLTEMGRQAVTDSMDVHGGKGIMLGPNNYLARGYQGAPIAITVEGANILTRNMMIYGQGAMRSHPYVLKLIQTGDIKDQEEELLQFDSLLFSHIGFALSNFFRAIWFSLSFARFTGAPFNDSTAKYYRALTRISTNMALLSDIAMGLLGGTLKRKERTSARLGDMLSYQYLATAALKRFDEDGRHKEDQPLLDWSVQYCLAKAEAAQRDLLENFPSPVVGTILKVLLMPFGTSYKNPSDKLDHKVSVILQTPGAARTRLGQGQYLSREPNNLMGDLEQTLEDIIACEPIFDRIVKAVGEKLSFTQLDKAADKGLELGVINEQEADLLRKAEQGRLRTINVDDFDPAVLPAGKPKTRAKK